MEETRETVGKEVITRGNGSQVFTQPFSEAGMNRLKHLIITFYKQGERKFYSVLVDGEIIIPKTCDGRKFDRYIQFVNPHTHTVEVRMYQGQSPNCNRHQFIVHKGFSGFGEPDNVQTQIDKALEQQATQNRLGELEKELSRKSKKLRKLKKFIDEADSESGLDKVKEFASQLMGFAGALGIGRGIPTPNNNSQESEVEIEPDEDTSGSQQIFDDMVETFGEEGVKNALGWMTVLASNPDLQEKLKEEIKNLKQEKNG